MKKISKETGELTISGIEINANKSEEYLKENFTISSEDRIKGWSSYYLTNELIGDVKVNIRITYSPLGKLTYIKIAILNEFEVLTWENWSEERELNRKKNGDLFLYSVLGPPPYDYDWGVIKSTYDAKSGGAGISINYFV